MITGIDLTQIVEYQLKDDKENPTVWKIGVIPSLVFMSVVQATEKDRIKASYQVLQLALKGWDNFDIPFETEKEMFCGRELDVVPMRLIERIPANCIIELSSKILEVNQITENERKN